MSEQILKIEHDPKDKGCIQITLRHTPGKLLFWKQATVSIYKGYGRSWYHLPSFKPAPSRLIPLLKAISYAPQFKHLRCGL